MNNRKHQQNTTFSVQMRWKLLVTFGVIMAFLVFLVVRLFIIALGDNNNNSIKVYENFGYDSRTIPAQRGDITDRNGTVLAYSSKTYRLILDTKVLLSKDEYREPTVKALLNCFELDKEELDAFISENKRLKDEGKTPSAYKILLSDLTDDDRRRFDAELYPTDEDKEVLKEKKENAANIKGVWFEEVYKRSYPYNSLACDVIGSVRVKIGRAHV